MFCSSVYCANGACGIVLMLLGKLKFWTSKEASARVFICLVSLQGSEYKVKAQDNVAE